MVRRPSRKLAYDQHRGIFQALKALLETSKPANSETSAKDSLVEVGRSSSICFCRKLLRLISSATGKFCSKCLIGRGDHLGLVGQAGPLAHQTHAAAQHVEQLRQLVELERMQPLADRRDPARGHFMRPPNRRAMRRGSELVAVERFSDLPTRACTNSAPPGDDLATR